MLQNLMKLPLRNLRTGTTVDIGEVEHFKRLSEDWWNQYGVLKPLHAYNKLRVPFICDGILSIQNKNEICSLPLKEVSILDVGCGAGILSEPLAKIGGNVTGIDPSSDLIELAKFHAKDKKHLRLNYISSSVNDYSCDHKEKHDVVVASEVIEHVTEKKQFLEACIQCVKPGGSVFITTMNRSLTAYVLGILFAESFGFIPKGTHQYEKFIAPIDLEKMFKEFNCKTVLSQGTWYNFLNNEWYSTSNDSLSYALHAVKHEK